MPPTIKICGISTEASLLAAVNAGAHFIGFVHFPKSPRHVSLARAAELKQLLPAHVDSVLVTVDPTDDELNDIATILAPSYLQLHGSESPTRMAEIRAAHPTQKLIKAIAIASPVDLARAKDYEPYAEMLLFDATPPITNHQSPITLPGGNGISFDWKILEGFTCRIPWMLSGGLNKENIHEALAQSGAAMVDVSSGVESGPGKKDIAMIQEFIEASRDSYL